AAVGPYLAVSCADVANRWKPGDLGSLSSAIAVASSVTCLSRRSICSESRRDPSTTPTERAEASAAGTSPVKAVTSPPTLPALAAGANSAAEAAHSETAHVTAQNRSA